MHDYASTFCPSVSLISFYPGSLSLSFSLQHAELPRVLSVWWISRERPFAHCSTNPCKSISLTPKAFRIPIESSSWLEIRRIPGAGIPMHSRLLNARNKVTLINGGPFRPSSFLSDSDSPWNVRNNLPLLSQCEASCIARARALCTLILSVCQVWNILPREYPLTRYSLDI